MTRIVRAAAVAGAIAVSLALSVAPLALAADHGVDIAGFAFSPGSITIHVGDTVTWSNADAQSHTATADDGSFDTGTITTSTPKTVTFSTAGTFAYHCSIHRSMTATIVVEDAAASAPPTDTVAAVPATAPPARAAWLALAVAAIGGFLIAAWRFRTWRA